MTNSGLIASVTDSERFSNIALDFDGFNEGNDCGNHADLQITNKISVFCWVKGGPLINKPFLCKWEGLGKRSWYLGSGGATSPTKGRMLLSRDGSFDPGEIKAWDTSIDVLDDEWNHFGFTFESNLANAYVNGTEDTSMDKIANDIIVSIYNTSQTVRIGETNTAFFTGNLDHCVIFKDRLLAAEVLELYKIGRPGDLTKHSKFSDSVLWQWMGDGDTIPNIADHSAAGNSPGLTANMTAANREPDTAP